MKTLDYELLIVIILGDVKDVPTTTLLLQGCLTMDRGVFTVVPRMIQIGVS
jgi:hypothetical protein